MAGAHIEADDDRPVIFNLEGLGQLTLESTLDAGGEDLMVSLALPLPPHDEERLLAALALCHPDQVHPFSLGCGLHKGRDEDHLIFMSRQNRAAMTAASLENQALFLIHCAKTVGYP
jgi:type III secretion system chaperone SycN